MTHELNILQSTTRCRHLLSKRMYIHAGLSPQDQVPPTGDDDIWCGKTQTLFGPDDQICEPDACCKPGRPCYEVM